MDNNEKHLNLIKSLDALEAFTLKRQEKSPNNPFYKLVINQVDDMRRASSNGQIPTHDDVDKIVIGQIAVREFEVDDPEYVSLICSATYAFSELANKN